VVGAYGTKTDQQDNRKKKSKRSGRGRGVGDVWVFEEQSQPGPPPRWRNRGSLATVQKGETKRELCGISGAGDVVNGGNEKPGANKTEAN